MAARKKPAKKRRTARTPKKDAWPKRFLAALRLCGNVSEAATAAGAGRRTVYDRRESDPGFAASWDDALDEATDALEAEARRRGKDGVNEPVIYQGELMGVWVNDAGDVVSKGTPNARQVPLTIKKYSDTLLIFLLKANRPDKFRERSEVKHTGANGGPIQHEHTHLSDDERRAILGAAVSAMGLGTGSTSSGQPGPAGG